MRRAAVHRHAETIQNAAEELRRNFHVAFAAARNNAVAEQRPSVSSSGMDRTRPSRKPMTWVRMARPPRVRISQKSPMAAAGPRDSTIRPTSSTTSPSMRTGCRRFRRAA